MADPRAEAAPAVGRIALVGAGSPEGVRVRRALEAMQIGGDRVDLFGSGDAVLSEYDGEARMIQQADRAALEGHGLIFVCDVGDQAGRFLSDPAPGAATLDLTGSGVAELGLPLAHDRLLPPGEVHEAPVLAVPHSMSLLLVDLLAPFLGGPGLRSFTAVVLRPAADFGAGAVDELRQQTVDLLNFGSPPTEHLGRPLAFNVLPGPYLPDGGRTAPDRIVPELAALTGVVAPAAAVDEVGVPLFYGHGVVLMLETVRPVNPADLYGLYDGNPTVQASPVDDACTPMEVGDRGGTRVTGIRAEPGDGRRIRLWAAAGDADNGAAVQAVRLARQLGAL